MRIWHVSAEAAPETVNGMSNSAWAIASAQAREGHEVTLFVESQPQAPGRQRAAEAGLHLVPVGSGPLGHGYGARCLAYAAKAGLPDIVQMYSVFIPSRASLGGALRGHGIPYIIRPAGGLSQRVFDRGRLKKRLYSALVERRLFSRAGGIVALTPVEVEDIRRFVPGYRGIVREMPNPVDLRLLVDCPGAGGTSGNRLVFMGRYDVYNKGLDLLSEIARLTPEVQYDLYGECEKRRLAEFEALRAHAPGNMRFHPPVMGEEKIEVLRRSSAVILTSRWEALSRTVMDAMSMGTPCFISETVAVAGLVRQKELGVVMPADPGRAAAELRRWLADRTRLMNCALRAKQFAAAEFAPQSVARKYLQFYADVLACQGGRGPGGSRRPVGEGDTAWSAH